MQTRHPTRILAAALALAVTLSAHAAENGTTTNRPAEDGWMDLFDGKTLDGWKANEAQEAWKVEDGCITVNGPFSHLFYVGADGKAMFSDFELKVEMKAAPGTNSGIFFRVPPMEKCDKYLNGSFEAQIQNDGKSPCYTGGLWGHAPRAEPSPVKPDEWFEVHIIAVGDKITVRINGKITTEYDKPKKITSGHIALQGHGPGHKPMFRKIRVRPISNASTQPATKPVQNASVVNEPVKNPKETRIYYLGNSLTDELQYNQFVKLAESGGEKIVWGRHMIPGSPIHGLYKAANQHGIPGPVGGKWPEAFEKFQWDVVTLQPFAPFQEEYEHARLFCPEIMKKSPDAQVFIYAQWPGKERGSNWDLAFSGPEKIPDWMKQDAPISYLNMAAKAPSPWKERFAQMSLRNVYELIAVSLNEEMMTHKPVRLIPVGHVMQLLGQKMRAGLMPGYRSPWDFYSDGVHVNNDGSYIVACAFYATIFGKTPVGLPIGDYQGKPGFRDDGVRISPELAKLIQETVWEVVATHPLSGVTSGEPLKVASPILDAAVVGEPYRFEVLPAFGKAPRKWNVAAGQLPTGISLSDDGVLGGTPEKTGDRKVTLAVADAAGASATKEFTFKVETAVPPRIPEQNVPAMSVGKFGEYRLISEAGNGIHSWRIKGDGVLPPGLNLAPDGRLWGSPGKQGEHTFTLEVLDGKTRNPGLAERSFTLRVGPPQGDVAFARRLTKAPTFDTADKANPAVNPADWNFRHPIRKLVAGETATVTGAFDVAWDEQNLYVAVKVDDPTVNDGMWSQNLAADNVILCLDAFNNREATYNADDRHVVSPRKFIYFQRSLTIGEEWGLICRQAERDGGYLAVFRVTWNNLGLPAKMSPHWTIGLDLMLVDDAKDGIPKSMVVWQGSQTNDKDPSQFGTVVLAP